MECNNKYCYWCTFEQCCHEDEKVHGDDFRQKPNQLDCPSALRSDFEEMFYDLYDWNLEFFMNVLTVSKDEAEFVLGKKNFADLLKLYNILPR